MTIRDLLPYVTGGGGALVALTIIAWLLLTERLVPGSAHKRALDLNAKLEAANDVLQRTLEAERDQKQQLIGGTQLANQLAGAVVELARGRSTNAIVPAVEGQGGP